MMRAIVADLDDTLLKYDKTISEFTKKILLSCSSKGMKVIFATARGTSAKDLIPFELFDGRIMLNGALAEVNNGIVYKKLITPQVFCPFLQRMDELHINAAAEINGVHFAIFDVSSKWKRDFILTDFTNIEENSEKLYVVINSPDQAKSVSKWLPAELYVHFTKDNLALIMNREATKLRALSALLNLWGISFTDVIAFGDDVNDKEILAKCGTGIAMKNALDDIKEIANDICDDCDNDGVAKWLSDYISKNYVS